MHGFTASTPINMSQFACSFFALFLTGKNTNKNSDVKINAQRNQRFLSLKEYNKLYKIGFYFFFVTILFRNIYLQYTVHIYWHVLQYIVKLYAKPFHDNFFRVMKPLHILNNRFQKHYHIKQPYQYK